MGSKCTRGSPLTEQKLTMESYRIGEEPGCSLAMRSSGDRLSGYGLCISPIHGLAQGLVNAWGASMKTPM